MNRRAFLTTANTAVTAVTFTAVLRAQTKDPVRIGCPLPLSGPLRRCRRQGRSETLGPR